MSLAPSSILPPAFLAQAEQSSSIYFWTIILLVVLVGAAATLAWVRRRLSPNEDFRGEGFTLSDLRRMHKEGKLTDAEFERAKAKMVATMHAAQERQEAARAEAAKRGSM